MTAFRVLFDLVLAAPIVWYAILYTRAFRAAEGSTWDRVLAAAKGSATIFWAQAVIFATALVNGIGNLSDAIDPGIGEQIKSYLPSEYVAGFVMLTMFITIVARLRTLVR